MFESVEKIEATENLEQIFIINAQQELSPKE